MSDKQILLDMSGQVALVTGAGQGVGRGIALLLAAHNAKVVVNDYFQDRAQGVADEIKAAGGEAIGVQADVTDYQSVGQMFEAATAAFGDVDVLINNAGVG